ncbi:MAG: folate-binding protein YgfZ [Hyphomicrobiaceae bacterium]|nr:folate-binding protein YgfZ [Hyphomicrobiaceae bacterium]MCC0008527.1 folate-binding protein YgfZ [Hyphomicrobiaceae bacterium]
MSKCRMALLPDRGVLAITGEDREKLVQGIATNDLARLETERALHTGLLSPQGKILFDFFVVRTTDALLIETARASVAALKQRLDMYRLRAKADVADVSGRYTVVVCWGGPHAPDHEGSPTVGFSDPRHPELGTRHLASLESEWNCDAEGAEAATQDDYHAHRIAIGVPEAGRDFALGDTFPHEALYDQTRSVSFTKGCYVGQEVVSRMQHRATARKRVVPVVSSSALPEPGSAIRAGDVTIGTLGSVAGTRALAMLRLDRVAEFRNKGIAITAGSAPIEIKLPDWVTFPLVPPDAAGTAS